MKTSKIAAFSLILVLVLSSSVLNINANPINRKLGGEGDEEEQSPLKNVKK
jgi:hypothetical protein